MQAFLSESALHQFQIPQLIGIRCLRFGQNPLIQHSFVDFQELLLRTVDVDQSRDDVILPSLRADELSGLAVL